MRDALADRFPEALVMEGFDDCLVGVVHRFGQEPVACYSQEMVPQKLQDGGMTPEEALEWHDVNQLGAWVGDTTPCFLEDPRQ